MTHTAEKDAPAARPMWLDPWSPWPVGNWCVQPLSLGAAAALARVIPAGKADEGPK